MEEELQRQLPTWWLEAGNSEKLQALDKSGLKPYVVKVDSIRPFLGQIGHLVEEFWENFIFGCSTVVGNKISVEEQDIFKATALPNNGRTVGYWFQNKNSKVERMGKAAWNANHAMRLKQLCGFGTNFKQDIPVDMIKDNTTRYLASLVMEHLSGMPTVSLCNYGFLDAIEEGLKGNVTNWCAHITKRMKSAVKKVHLKALSSGTKETQFVFSYGAVIALLVREQAPDLWQQVVENGGRDFELLKKRRLDEINGLQDIELRKRRMNEINGVQDIELLRKRRMNEINAVQGSELLKQTKIREINGNGFELGSMKVEGEIEGREGDQYREKRLKVDLEQEGGSGGGEGVQMQEKLGRKEGMNGLDDQSAAAVLRRIKVGLAEECAETVERYLADREGWMEASVQDVSDGELLEQYYSDLNFRLGDHVLDDRLHSILKSQWRRFSGWVELQQRKMMKREYDKLLVISMEYILAHFVHKSKVPFAHGDLYVDPYIVFVHPQACRFLWACLSVFKVVLWSEKPREVHDLVLQHILGGTTSSDCILSYSVEDCIMTRISREGDVVHGCYKDLTRVWEDLGDYGSANTLLVDTSNLAMLKNQEGNVICPIPYQYHMQVSHWQLETYLLPYLECLESVHGIPQFVKNFPFRLEKRHAWERPQFQAGRVTSFAIPCPPRCHGIIMNWKMFPSIVTENSNSQLDPFNSQCPGISNTGQQFPITRTSISFSQSVPPAANLGIFEMCHGISSGVFLGFNDHTQTNNNMNYTRELTKLSDDKMKCMRELVKKTDENMKCMRELNQVKIVLHNMAYEKDNLEKLLQEVIDALEKTQEEKRKAEEKNTDLSKALKHVEVEKNLGMKQRENIISSLRRTVQALEEKLGSFALQQREFQTLVKREVEKETVQIRSTLTNVLRLKQDEDSVVEAEKLITESRQQGKLKQSNNKGKSSHMSGDKSTVDGSHLFLTSDTEYLHCSICMEEWTTAGNHRICSLACGHMFGMSCITQWLQLHENNIGKCPQCNNKAELGDIRILYFPAIAQW